jgi:type I restriction enzyme S subunit
MPNHWQTIVLGDAAEVNPKEPPLPEDAPFVPMDAVKAGQRWVGYTEPRGRRSGARARAGDILFARITPCLENGKTAQVQPEIERCGGSTEFIVLRGSDRLDPDFLYVWATDQSVRTTAASLMTGSTGRQRLSAKDLAAMTLDLPSIAEQRRIVDLVGSVDEQADSLESQIASSQLFRAGLLTGLLSGERILDESYGVAVTP